MYPVHRSLFESSHSEIVLSINILLLLVFVCLCLINVKTAKQIGPKFLLVTNMTPGKMYGISKLKIFDLENTPNYTEKSRQI